MDFIYCHKSTQIILERYSKYYHSGFVVLDAKLLDNMSLHAICQPFGQSNGISYQYPIDTF